MNPDTYIAIDSVGNYNNFDPDEVAAFLKEEQWAVNIGNVAVVCRATEPPVVYDPENLELGEYHTSPQLFIEFKGIIGSDLHHFEHHLFSDIGADEVDHRILDHRIVVRAWWD